MFVVFLLLYVHAYRQREALGLNELEVFETTHSIRAQIFAIGTGLTYLLLAGVLALPRTTPSEKLLMRILALVCLAFLIALVAWIVVVRRKRAAWMKAWHTRNESATLLHEN